MRVHYTILFTFYKIYISLIKQEKCYESVTDFCEEKKNKKGILPVFEKFNQKPLRKY